VTEPASDDDGVRSLAAIREGETRVVERILFDLTRARCAALGIIEGDRVLCRRATHGQLWLETSSGAIVTIDREWATFIQVGDALADVAPRAAAASYGARVPSHGDDDRLVRDA
jgi:hypothetical protein